MENKFELFEDLRECYDSMLFDSGTQIATYGTPDNYVSLEVMGDVKVDYNGNRYRYATEMPEELLEKFKVDYWNDEDIEIIDNNWFEYIHVLNGIRIIQEESVTFDDALYQYTEEDLEEALREVYEWFNEEM